MSKISLSTNNLWKWLLKQYNIKQMFNADTAITWIFSYHGINVNNN